MNKNEKRIYFFTQEGQTNLQANDVIYFSFHKDCTIVDFYRPSIQSYLGIAYQKDLQPKLVKSIKIKNKITSQEECKNYAQRFTSLRPESQTQTNESSMCFVYRINEIEQRMLKDIFDK